MNIKNFIASLLIMSQSLTLGCTEKINKASTVSTVAITPWDYQKQLGRGLDVDWSKTKDGIEYYNTKTAQDFKANGVSHVRIRIKDNVSDKMLQGLDTQIKDCLDNNLIPVIAYQADDFKNSPSDENFNKVVDWWTKVSEHYKSYPYLLSFDLIIEVTDALNKQPERLNELYEKLVTSIRKSNPYRIIMISPVVRSSPENLAKLKIPTNSNGYLMAEWHFYAAGPSKMGKEKPWTSGTEEEKNLILSKIDTALEWQKSNNIPTWVGAWMPSDYNDGNSYTIDEQVNFASFITKALSDAKIPFAVNSDTKFYNREKNTWIEEMKPVFNAIFSSSKQASSTTYQQGISAGFNAKANLSAKEQCYYLNQELSLLKSTGVNTNKIWLRLNGGTISQKTMPSDWNNEMISQWTQIQKEFGCPYIFVVNFNDTPQSQKSFYDTLVNKGISFAGIELGNEQYLARYSEAYNQKYSEVTQRTSSMTPQKYIQMSNEYIELLKNVALPFYVQFAPLKEREDYLKWNKAIAEAINSKNLLSQNLYGTIHLYERDGDNSLDAKQINTIRSLVKSPIPFAITESGVVDTAGTLAYSKFIEQEQNLTGRILGQLKAGDLFLNQVLYTDYKEVGPEILHPAYKGVTPKGNALIEILKKYW